MHGARIFRRHRHMRLDYLEHEHAVGGDKLRIVELALEARVAFLDQRRADAGSRDCGQSKLGEFVDVSSRAVADAHDLGSEIDGRDVDDALAAVSDHLEAVVLVPDVAANQRRLEAMTMCQLMLALPRQAELTSTIGPGSR